MTKKLGLILTLAAGLALLPLTASADSINFGGGNIVLTSIGASQVGITFESFGGVGPVTILNQVGTVSALDPLNGAPVDLTPNNGSFVFTNSGAFVSGSDKGTLGINGAGGSLAADVQLVSLTANGSGGFTLTLNFDNVAGNGGTSTLLTNFLGDPTPEGGVLTFQIIGANSLNSLFDSNSSTSVSGSIAAPEPETLALLGIGLLGLCGLLGRRYRRGIEA